MQSDYLKKLLLETPDVGERYLLKLKIIGDLDPYTIHSSELDFTIKCIPPITIIDIYTYLVNSHSYYSKEQMKAYKSLQAHKYFTSGFILKVGVKIVNDFYIIVGKVKHSQKANAKPLDAWVIASSDGDIANAHCMCMAGNSEVCSHIAALLFAAEYAHAAAESKTQDPTSCTDVTATWPMPALSTVVPIVPCLEMDFGKPLSKHKFPEVPDMSNQDVENLLKRMENLGKSSSLMRIVEPYASKIDATRHISLPLCLNIYREEYEQKSFKELMEIANKIVLVVTKDQAYLIEEHTRAQYACDNWYSQRAGRITASKFKAVCRTKKTSPSLSLIKSICYPTKLSFKTKATDWGLKHEVNAIEKYEEYMTEEEHHEDFIINDVGLIVNHRWPQIGVSPDKLVYCECCKGGCLEVKCPYLLHTNNVHDINEYLAFKNCCLIKENDLVILNKNHSYYYQVQCQIFISNLLYCDFVIWSPKIFFRQRILPDWDLWNDNLKLILKFHSEIIMPELLGRYFTKREGNAKVEYWCYCKGVDNGSPMLKCDNDDCNVQWFHFKCVGISETPDSLWYCQSCKI
ncbi:uncharacterized protein [Diabrotica undecimpunctata]|uniref:uncharacterized protein n=1 Tax=Diabrotica undecimpunctata TaxID=50387 RepID=UPI003B63ADA0